MLAKALTCFSRIKLIIAKYVLFHYYQNMKSLICETLSWMQTLAVDIEEINKIVAEQLLVLVIVKGLVESY